MNGNETTFCWPGNGLREPEQPFLNWFPTTMSASCISGCLTKHGNGPDSTGPAKRTLGFHGNKFRSASACYVATFFFGSRDALIPQTRSRFDFTIGWY